MILTHFKHFPTVGLPCEILMSKLLYHTYQRTALLKDEFAESMNSTALWGYGAIYELIDIGLILIKRVQYNVTIAKSIKMLSISKYLLKVHSHNNISQVGLSYRPLQQVKLLKCDLYRSLLYRKFTVPVYTLTKEF